MGFAERKVLLADELASDDLIVKEYCLAACALTEDFDKHVVALAKERDDGPWTTCDCSLHDSKYEV